MPTINTQQVKPITAKPKGNGPTIKGFLKAWGVAGAIVIAFIGMFLFSAAGGISYTSDAQVEDYLKDKYGQDFKVKDIKSSGSSIGDPGLHIGIGYPSNHSSITFEVGRDPDTNIYFDHYDGAVWAKEERPRVAALLGTLYGNSIPDFDLTTHISTPNTPDPIRGKVPPLAEAIRLYGDTLYYSLTIRSTLDTLSEVSKQDIRAKFTAITDYVKNKGAGLPYLAFTFNVTDENKGYLCRYGGELYQDKKKDCSK